MLAWVVDCRRDCRDLLVEGRVCESLQGTRLGQPPSICCEFHNLTIFWGGGRGGLSSLLRGQLRVFSRAESWRFCKTMFFAIG